MIKTNANRETDLVIDHVRFTYGSQTMEFDARIRTGTVNAITGPSGSGKSTLLNLIAGFEKPQSGRIFAGSTEITNLPPDQRPVSMIFQDGNLFDHLTVLDNVLLGVTPGLHPTGEQCGDAADAITRTGLAGKENRLPAQLSGGERQRVALARALIRKRPYLLMDEPFASLGPGLRSQMLELVLELQNDTGITILMVTHDPEEMVHLEGQYFFIDGGKIAATGPASDIVNKNNRLLSDYLGR